MCSVEMTDDELLEAGAEAIEQLGRIKKALLARDALTERDARVLEAVAASLKLLY